MRSSTTTITTTATTITTTTNNNPNRVVGGDGTSPDFRSLLQFRRRSSLRMLLFVIVFGILLWRNTGNIRISKYYQIEYANNNDIIITITTQQHHIDTDPILVNLFSISSYLEYSIQLETFFNDKLNDWFQRDVPLLLNSFQLPSTTKRKTTNTTTTTTNKSDDDSDHDSSSYDHHLQIYLQQIDTKDENNWRLANWTCHYYNYDHYYHYDQNKKKDSTTMIYHNTIPPMVWSLPAMRNSSSSSSSSWQVLPARLKSFSVELMVICPNQTQQGKVLIYTSVIPLGGGGVASSSRNSTGDDDDNDTNNLVIYDVRPYLRWDELARKEFVPPHQKKTTQQKEKQQQQQPQHDDDDVNSTTTTINNNNNNKKNKKNKSTSSMLFIGACTEFFGEESNYLTSQWIEYHRLLGVDHFWIYINGPFNQTDPYYNHNTNQHQHQHHHDSSSSSSSSSLHSQESESESELDENDENDNDQSYVTYVPYNYRLHGRWEYLKRRRGAHAFFQPAQNTECMYRGRQFNVDWMVMTDVDEFIQINTVVPDKEKEEEEEEEKLAITTNQTITTTSTTMKATGKEEGGQQQRTFLLRDYLQRELESSANIVMNSIPYGRNTVLNHPPSYNKFHKDIMIFDYIWRSNMSSSSIDEYPVQRVKNIVKPDKVGWLNIHYTSMYEEGYTSELRKASEIRINHYKQSWKHVFQADQRNVVADTQLRDRFGELLRNRLQRNWNRTFLTLPHYK